MGNKILWTFLALLAWAMAILGITMVFGPNLAPVLAVLVAVPTALAIGSIWSER